METTGGSQGADVPSLVARQAFIDGSKILQVQGTPAHALFHTDKYLVGDVTINIRIDPQSEDFCLMSSAATERLEILNAEFMVPYVKFSDSVHLQHIAIMSGTGRKGLRPRPALYPSGMRRCAGLQHCPGSVEFAKERFVSWQGTETRGPGLGPMRTWETKLKIHLISSSLF